MLSALNLQHDRPVSVGYGERFDSEAYKLLEVDERVLQELLENGLSIKGGNDDEAVLCTSTATYAMKFVSTSNTVLLVPSRTLQNFAGDMEYQGPSGPGSTTNVGSETNVVATAAGHIELVEISPKLETLKLLLSERPHTDDMDVEADEEGEGLYTWDDLVNRVQASANQLRVGLENIQAVQIGKYWRIVDGDFMHNVLQILLLTAIQHDWPLDALPGLDAVRALEADNYSPKIVMHCLDTYGIKKHSAFQGNPTEGTNSVKLDDLSGTGSIWVMDETKVCLTYAKKLLATNPKWKLEDFLDTWKRACPDGMRPHLHMLSGEVLVDVIGPESWLDYFSISSLPRKAPARFSALFKRRPKWEWKDLEPYLRDLKEPNRSVETMLLKYTRKTQPDLNLPAIYSAR